jgi:hypothetical protein
MVLTLLVVLAGAGGRWHARAGSDGLRLLAGIDRGSPGGGRDALLLARAHPDAAGAVDVDLMGNPYRNWYATLFAAALQRNYRYGNDWYLYLAVDQHPKTLAGLERMVAASPVRVRFHVSNPRASMLADPADPHPPRPRPGADPDAYGDPGAPTDIEAVEYLAARYPDRVEVVSAARP